MLADLKMSFKYSDLFFYSEDEQIVELFRTRWRVIWWEKDILDYKEKILDASSLFGVRP